MSSEKVVGAEARFAELRLVLPPAPQVIGVYRPVIEADGFLYLSGHGPLLADGSLIKGRLGAEIDVTAGYQAARQTGLAVLTTLRQKCGSLDRIARLVKTVGLVLATAEFTDHPAVINGFSELMRDVFGEENGIAARCAFGVTSLPAGMAVEIEAVFELAR
jgi:enamine deaminase RidA (YjgF/YER057c/UK114 family)